MKKRLRKKKQRCYFKKIDVEITSIESLEKDYNYIVTFKCYRPNKSYQAHLLKFTPSFECLYSMQNDLVNKTLLKGLIDFHHKDLFLYIPKYQIKAIDSVLCICHCVSGKNFEKTVERKYINTH